MVWFAPSQFKIYQGGGFGTTVGILVPMVVVIPMLPNIPSTTALGTVVATIMVTMSDGSAFTGTLTFGPPYFNDGGIYAITGASSPFSLIVNPSGPGVSSQGGSINNVTLVATQ